MLHAVPGLTVDVYANGEELIPDFEPGTLTDPLKLPAGTYDLTVFPAGEGPGGDPAIEANAVEVPAGANATVVAHLDANGDPMLSLFANDTSSVPAGQARLTARDRPNGRTDRPSEGTHVLRALAAQDRRHSLASDPHLGHLLRPRLPGPSAHPGRDAPLTQLRTSMRESPAGV